MGKFQLLAQRSNFALSGIDFLFRSGNSVGTNVMMEEKEEGVWVEPTFRLEITEAQALMDSLWDCGLRPTNAKPQDGELSATRLHLQDERELAKRLLDKILENRR